MREFFEEILQNALKAISKLYRQNLVSVAVFGSVARGTPGPESDIDLLIVCQELPQGIRKRINDFLEVEKELEPLLREAGKKGVHVEISPILKTIEEVKAGSWLFLDFVEEARIIYDKGSFFSTFLESLQVRLKKLGARRIKRGDRWYWVLKPDLKPGEVFEV